MSDNVRFLPPHRIPPRGERDWITAGELRSDASISPRQLDYWVRTGLLTPLDALAPGHGHPHRFDLDQLDKAIAVRELLDAGISLSVIRARIDEFVEHGVLELGPITIARTTQEA